MLHPPRSAICTARERSHDTNLSPAGASLVLALAVGCGGGTSQTVDWSAGVTGVGSGIAPNQTFSTQADLINAHLIFTQNGSGGCDAAFVNGTPTDPTP